MPHDKNPHPKWQDKPRKPLPATPRDATISAIEATAYPDGTTARDVVFSTSAASFLGCRATGPTTPTVCEGLLPVALNITPRRMWGWGPGSNGFCGECCFQDALLFFGNYVSQERVRYADGNKELLVGVQDRRAAKRLHLNFNAFDFNDEPEPRGSAYLRWAVGHIHAGHPIVAGWFADAKGGDDDYDHIMPIVGVCTVDPAAAGSTGKRRGKHGPAVQAMLFHDLAVATPRVVCAQPTAGGVLQTTRGDFSDGKPYDGDGREPLPREGRFRWGLPRDMCYGCAITGVHDPKKETRRMLLTVDRWDEPDWSAEDGVNAAPVALTVSASVVDLVPGDSYVVLRFDSVSSVPHRGEFLASDTWTRAWSFVAGAACVKLVNFDTVPSDGEYFYRTVCAAC